MKNILTKSICHNLNTGYQLNTIIIRKIHTFSTQSFFFLRWTKYIQYRSKQITYFYKLQHIFQIKLTNRLTQQTVGYIPINC